MSSSQVPQEPSEGRSAAEALRRLHWGAAGVPVPGWVNADAVHEPGLDVSGDLREGLPLAQASFDYVVAVRALSELPYGDLEGALSEFKRLLRPGGVLRLVVPDLERAARAYFDGDVAYLRVTDDDARSLGGKLVLHLTGYGRLGSLYTFDAMEELLLRAGFRRVARCALGETLSGLEGITDLDDLEGGGLVVEGIR